MAEVLTRKTFRNLVKSEAKHASIYTFLTLITQLSSFLIVPLFWKKLTPADYGIIAIVEIIAGFVNIFAGFSLDLSVTRFYYEWPKEERKKRLGTLWVLNWASCIVIGIVSIYLLSFVSEYLFPGVAFYPYLLLGMITKILMSLTTLPLQLIRIKKQPFVYSIYSLFILFTWLGFSVYFVLVLNKGLVGYFISGIFSGALVCVFTFILMLFYAIPCFWTKGLRDVLQYALPMIPSSVISSMTGFVDRFLLQRFASIEALGIYTLSLRFANLVFSLHSALKMSYMPFLFKTVSDFSDKEAKYTISRVNLLYFFPLFIAGLFISLFVKDFVYFVNRPNYFSIINYVPFLIIPTLLLASYVYFMPGLLLSKRTDLYWIPTAVQFVVVLVSGLIFIPTLKINGIIITYFLNNIAYIVTAYILSHKVYPLPTKWAKIFILFLFMIACSLLGNLFIVKSPPLSIVFKLTIILLYTVFGVGVISNFRIFFSRKIVFAKNAPELSE